MSKKVQLLRYLGVSAYTCGALVSFLVCFYPELFWDRSMTKGLIMLISLVAAAAHKVAMALIVRPFKYYIGLLQLHFLRKQIDEQTRTLVVRELTVEYFLGRSVQGPSATEVSKVKQ